MIWNREENDYWYLEGFGVVFEMRNSPIGWCGKIIDDYGNKEDLFFNKKTEEAQGLLAKAYYEHIGYTKIPLQGEAWVEEILSEAQKIGLKITIVCKDLEGVEKEITVTPEGEFTLGGKSISKEDLAVEMRDEFYVDTKGKGLMK